MKIKPFQHCPTDTTKSLKIKLRNTQCRPYYPYYKKWWELNGANAVPPTLWMHFLLWKFAMLSGFLSQNRRIGILNWDLIIEDQIHQKLSQLFLIISQPILSYWYESNESIVSWCPNCFFFSMNVTEQQNCCLQQALWEINTFTGLIQSCRLMKPITCDEQLETI